VKILYIAEIVGKAGIACCKKALAQTRRECEADFVVACADGVTNGSGLGRSHAAYLRKLGIDVLTMGERAFYKKDLTEAFQKTPWVLRPENLVPGAPGSGARLFKTASGRKMAVITLLGQSHFHKTHGDNPFERLPLLLERFRAETPFILVDIHAQATAEKQTLFLIAAGKATAVIGSHTRIQTADEKIIRGTAVISCAGRTGSLNSVGGCDALSRVNEYLTGIPDWTRPAWDLCELQGVLIEANDAGKALSIQRLRIPVPVTPA
jgi:metallophosphoesterase (TIGR00282 family)